VIILRRTRPDLPRSFRVPLMPVLPVLSALASFYLMLNLPAETWIRFAVWMVVGVILYAVYGRRRSRLATGGALDPALAADREAARGRSAP
jgi:APA family basic amino acid/polyamine antiporter